MKVFITGATGYVGAYLVKRLENEGHIVHALVRSIDKASFIKSDNILLFKGDLLNKDSIRIAMNNCHKVFHLAACTSIWEKDPSQYFKINVTGTQNILDIAKELNIEKTVITSTGGVFGPSINDTITEESPREIDFFNEYESSKSISESAAKSYVLKYNMNIVLLNPTRIYGPYLFGESSSITLMIEKYIQGKWKLIPGDGKQIGNYVYIEDVVEGLIKAMEVGMAGENYILGGFNHNYNELFNIIKEVSGKNYKLYGAPMWLQLFYGNLQLLKAKLLGKNPAITPKWIKRGNYNWNVSSEKSQNKLAIEYTTLKSGIIKTVEWVKNKE